LKRESNLYENYKKNIFSSDQKSDLFFHRELYYIKATPNNFPKISDHKLQNSTKVEEIKKISYNKNKNRKLSFLMKTIKQEEE